MVKEQKSISSDFSVINLFESNNNRPRSLTKLTKLFDFDLYISIIFPIFA